jgi:methylase of polypeptide subunit release factors
MKINFEIISIFLEYDNWHQALKQVFALVGTLVNVDRIYYFEIHEDYGSETKKMLEEIGFENGIILQDLQEKNRFIKASLK